MNYLKHYENLIGRAKFRHLTGYQERHHIIPKCIGGSCNKNNIVNLTAREHYAAHQLLVKIYPNEPGVILAVRMMTVENKLTQNRSNNRLYEWLKKRKIKGKSGKHNSQFGKVWIYNNAEKISKKIDKSDLSEYLELGWKKGRKLSFTATTKEKHIIAHIQKGLTSYQICKKLGICDSGYNYRKIQRIREDLED